MYMYIRRVCMSFTLFSSISARLFPVFDFGLPYYASEPFICQSYYSTFIVWGNPWSVCGVGGDDLSSKVIHFVAHVTIRD